jgi:hypothetical protein
MLAITLVQCSSLRTLSLADTLAGCMTFMTWPQRGPGSTQPAPSASSVFRPAALPAALPPQEAVGALGVRMLLYASLSQGQQQQQHPPQAGAAAAALPSGRSGSSSSSSGAPPAGSAAVASISPAPKPPVCVLRVLDVSGCAALSAGAAPAAKLFQAVVGAMPHLEGEPDDGGGGGTGPVGCWQVGWFVGRIPVQGWGCAGLGSQLGRC